MPLLKALHEIGQDVDLMVEAKLKDQAMLKLIEEVAKIRGVKRISGGTVVVEIAFFHSVQFILKSVQF